MSAAPPQDRTGPPGGGRGSESNAAARPCVRGEPAGVQLPACHHRRGQPNRQIRRKGRDPVPPRAQRLPALRSCEVDHPQFRPRGRERRTLQPPVRRHQPDERGRRIRDVDRRCRALARLRLGHPPLPRVRLLRSALRVCRVVHRARPRLRGELVAGRDARAPRYADRSRYAEPVPEPRRGREPRSVPADEGRRVSGRRSRAAAQDRHGEPEHQHARSGHLPDPPRVAPSHRRQVVHLPALRLHALHLRRAGRHHPLDLHARVPGPSAPVRLGARAARRRRPAAAAVAAAARIRPAEPDARAAVEAEIDRARGAAPCRRLGRSADADSGRGAAAGFHARGLQALRRAHRRVEVRFVDRHERARGLHARGPQRARAAAHGGARSRPAGDRQLSGGTDGRMPGAEPSAAAGPGQACAAVRARALDRAR